jgi:hypothetical protein
MRITVTLDPDVEDMLIQAAHRSGKTVDATLNEAVRAALAPPRGKIPPPQWPCHDMGSARVDLSRALALADALEDRGAATKAAPPG